MRHRVLRRLPALLLVLALAAPAAGTTLNERRVTCPACEKALVVLVVRSTNTFGGIDSDGCWHANGDPPQSFRVWTCTGCLHSAPAESFEEEVPEPIRKRIREELKSPVPLRPEAGQKAIPAWVKCDLALKIMEWRRAKDAEVFSLLCTAAVMERCESERAVEGLRNHGVSGGSFREELSGVYGRAASILPGPPGTRTRAGRRVLAALEALREAGDGDAASLRELAAALVLREHGEFPLAEPVLRRVAEREGTPAEVRDAAGEVLRSLARERGWRERALGLLGPRLERIRKGGLVDRAAAGDAHFAAETLRRLGRDAEAADWLDRALGMEGTAPWTILAAREAAAFDPSGSPKWGAVAGARYAAWIASLLEGVAAGEEGDGTVETLMLLRDPDALPGLLRILGGEAQEGRARAAQALGGYPEPGPEAEKALVRILRDPDEDEVVLWQAAEALVAAAPEAARPAFMAAVESGNPIVVELALRGLGLVGDAEAVPLLLAGAADEPETALRSLSLLSGRELDTLEEARAWWGKGREGPREAWAAEAFAAAGFAVGASPGRDAVPALLAALEDERLPVRWAAFRALRALSGRSLGAAELLYEGRSPVSSGDPVRITVEEFLGEGRILTPGVTMDIDIARAMGEAGKPLLVRDARPRWERAAARWSRWWEESGRK